ncbi:MAG: hypothetical protein JNM84_04150 [Planctomycetes bacterium]|nr:hypothetical protein [Planctomycetota bacterium]
MNKEMVTCGVVAALVAGLYFLGGERPAEAARVVQRERGKIAARNLFLDLEVAPVHRVDRLDRVRNPDDMRRFVDLRERDPFARPRIGVRLALPDLVPPQVFADELELLPPPPAPHGSWKLLGSLLRGTPAAFPAEIVAPAEETAATSAGAEGASAEEGAPSEGSSESRPAASSAQDAPWQGPRLAGMAVTDLARAIAEVWEQRWAEGRPEWIDGAYERWLEVAPNDLQGLVGRARWLDESLRWDEAFLFFREKLIGAQGEGPHGRDPRSLLAYGRFLQRTGLRDDGASYLQRAVEALGSVPLVAAEAQALWREAAEGLCASGRAAVAFATRPAQPIEAATWAMIVRAAYGAGELAELAKLAAAGATALAAASGDKDAAWLHARALAAFLERSSQVKPRADAVEALIAHAEFFAQLGGDARSLGMGALDLAVAAELAAARCYTLAAERAADEIGNRGTAPERRDALAKAREGALTTVRPLLLALRDRLQEIAERGTADTVGAHRGLAWMYLLAGDDQLADVEAEAGLAIDPEDTWLLYLRGAILLRRGELSQAAAALAALLRRAPEMQDALFLAGAEAWLSKDAARAGSLLDRVASGEERFVQGSYLSGLSELGRERLESAEQRFQTVLRLDPLHHAARIGQALVRYERLRDRGDVGAVIDTLEEIARRLETEDLRSPLLRYVRDLVTQLDRARNAREFEDLLDREQPLALYEWEPAVEAEGVPARLARWAAGEAATAPNEYGAQLMGSGLRFSGRFKQRGRTSFWTQTLIERPVDFLSVEADLWVPASNKARVGLVVGRMPLDAGKGPDLANASFLFGVSNVVDEATDQRMTQYIKTAGGQGQEWLADPAFLEKPFDWPADRAVRVRLEARHYRGRSGPTAEVRLTIGGACVHPGEEWIDMRPLQDQTGSGGLKLVFFAEGDTDRPADLRIDNIRVQYRDN